MPAKQCITFAGVVGSSKTPIANYLSSTLNLPILNNDAIRTEVREDLLTFDVEIYEQRQEQRCKELLKTGNTFIYDASIDRKWSQFNDWLTEWNYEYFIISLDLSHELLIALYKAKQYENTELLTKYINQHNNFLLDYGDLVGLHISDENFSNRLQIAYENVKTWANT